MTDFHHYGKNIYFRNSEVNITFAELMTYNDEQFEQWVKDVRAKIIEIWDEHNIPPINAYSREEIIDQFNKLHSHPVYKMFLEDESAPENGTTCIRNTHNKLGNACNSWFPTMMKTKINYGNGEARSIYDYIARDDLLEKYMPYARRHFQRDSFYVYSPVVRSGDPLPNNPKIAPQSAQDYILQFKKLETPYIRTNDKGEDVGSDFWIQAKKKEKVQEYTGYNENLKTGNILELSLNELDTLIDQGYINDVAISNIREGEWTDEYSFIIRVYDRQTRIFPAGLKSFRISVCQQAVNFPPLIAKAVWEKYTEEFKDDKEIIVYDPSAGWGGRLLGALSVKDDRNILYVGTDPNRDHTIYASGGVYDGKDNPKNYTKYDDLARFYNTKTSRATCLMPHTHNHKIYQLGSEVIHNNHDFQQYREKVSVVFTSPPYFHREEYSTGDTQSCHKFSGYDDWRDNFLRPTLQTARDWLREGGYLCWNISDIKEGKNFIPLEKDSCDIMQELGLEYVETLKLVLGQMPGGNRTIKNEDGTIDTTNKNSVRINGSYYRYEPIFVYKKVK